MRGDREIRGGGGRYEERERGGGRGGPTRLYVGRLTSRIRSRDLEDLFTKYGRLVGPFRLAGEGFGERDDYGGKLVTPAHRREGSSWRI
ncbi:hypothetical protein BDL97_05G010200 [Sphagnum fallax]|nr:hypothetical protein BDL97_05G010200 [Sphagnum fallax]